ncbi:histidinol dehydrogenase-domain-containing protein [Mycena sp. CBHHK59/15]|nr:histidinol dehydrogenase-domain-containing protein [Mycena sp. CBHHK59/15]
MSVFLPLLDQEGGELFDALSRIGPIVFPSTHSPDLPLARHSFILVDHALPFALDQAISWLDNGVDKIIVPLAWAKELIDLISSERLLLLLDVGNISAVSDTVRNGVSGVLLKTPTIDLDLIASISKFFTGSAIHVLSSSTVPPTNSLIRGLLGIGATPVLPGSQLTLSATSATQINIADAFLAPIVSDRQDGLFPTVVSTETGHSIGLVYSSSESVKESILTGKGVYQSRKHGLWRKGETSGATQDIVSIRLDCDSDSLEFRVVQHGAGFCHLNRPSCFGETSGLPALESTLRSRIESAPEGSYTKRLFNDSELLRSKIMEEADELCRAEQKEDVAFEAADLFYFALTKCIAAGIGISDIEASLDKKARRVTRRAGNAKPEWSKQRSASAVQPSAVPETDATIRMRTSDLSVISPEHRSALLRRPVLKSAEMINQVKPIVDDVRTRGDIALFELTAKFDKAKLTSTVIFPPFAPETMVVDPEVGEAIKTAYANIKKFHEAQADATTLVVETMPGVVCSRFARPIARVGLYVPGGTAILPSTALMLGIPAQVAGYGSISPEVMYVANLVGRGAQAVAALAYGTETVPKVIADYTANPAYVAADLLSQAEHGVDSQVVLIAVNLDAAKLAEIENEVDEQAHALSRVDIVRKSIGKSIIVKSSSVEEAIAFSNDYAPEHLILHLKNASEKVSLIDNAGSVFVGPYSPESCGDYASGTNHTLPTNGYARQFSGVNTLSFQKHITSQEITEAGLRTLGPVVATLADCEGLEAHANAVRIRLRN